MMAGPFDYARDTRLEVRVHRTLGWAVRWPGDEDWFVRLSNRSGPPARYQDFAVRGHGWEEWTVGR